MMKLWTWQNPILDITNPNVRIESRKYSEYQNYPEKYEKLWPILRTDQFCWYHTDKEEATNSDSLAEYSNKVLWEINIPEDKIFKKMCHITWHWILKNKDAKPPKIFESVIFSWKDGRATFNKDFNKPWRDMKPKQLWDCLFYDGGIKQCHQVLVRHPVDVLWVTKNPLKDINWWQKHQPINGCR